MKLSEDRLEELMARYFDERISAEEKRELWSYVDDPVYAERIQAGIPDATSNRIAGVDLNPVSEERILQHIFRQDIDLQPEIKPLKLWPRIAIAAALAAIVFGAGLFYFNGDTETRTGQVAYKNDVNPGVQGATLTLASGKKIRLSDAVNGELAKEAGVVITKSADGKLVYEIKGSGQEANKINTLSTANGETYQVRLPDGSLVHLNAASSLTYSASLMEQGKRIVRLQGEAFFEIARLSRPSLAGKQQAQRVPFIVETGSQRVEVLGTHFNVMAYGDESAVATTLIEGSVRVMSLQQGLVAKNGAILRPGEQALNDGRDIKVGPANLENVTDWKDGDFFLNHVNFKTAMRKIERWYNIEMIYDKSVPDDIESGGWISRSRRLSEVLRHIESSGQVHFKVEGRKVYVSR